MEERGNNTVIKKRRDKMVKIEDYLFSDKELDKAKRYCLCNHYNKNGKGLYCFKHKKQTPDKIAEVTNEGNKRD